MAWGRAKRSRRTGCSDQRSLGLIKVKPQSALTPLAIGDDLWGASALTREGCLAATVHAGFRQIMGKCCVFNRDKSYD